MENCSMVANDMPHAVCMPFPAQSHIKAMLKLAKLLHHKGFHITFVNTEHSQRRYIQAGGLHSVVGFRNFRFETISDGLPPVLDSDEPQDIISLIGAIRRNFSEPFCKLLAKLNGEAANDSNSPPVTCILADAVAAFAITAAQELGIPVASSWSYAACAFMSFCHYRGLLDKGLAPIKDTIGNMETTIDWIPGMKDIRVKDLPALLWKDLDPNEDVLYMSIEAAEKAREASAIAFHTFEALEQDVVDALRSILPHIYTIGPLQLLLNNLERDNPRLGSIGYNLWKEDPRCIQWLNSKEPSSVVYVNFGSITLMSLEHLIEFAWGLAKTNYAFLWIIRPDLVIGESAILPSEFAEETKERGMIASWCDQEEVLNHPSVGVFLTHSGWNSTVESLSSGVPVICWPYFGDQTLNCSYVCRKWGVGMEIDQNVMRDEVEKLVRGAMGGTKGKKMKDKAMEWRKLAEEATSGHGSSSLNLDKLVNVLLSDYQKCSKSRQKSEEQSVQPGDGS